MDIKNFFLRKSEEMAVLPNPEKNILENAKYIFFISEIFAKGSFPLFFGIYE